MSFEIVLMKVVVLIVLRARLRLVTVMTLVSFYNHCFYLLCLCRLLDHMRPLLSLDLIVLQLCLARGTAWAVSLKVAR